MTKRLRSQALLSSLAAFACFVASWAVADGVVSWLSNKKIDFELTGTVRDETTNQAIEGAFVLASYREMKSGLAATTSKCVKTRGMYTGKDGKYRFPVERLDGRSPYEVSAIKTGYFRGRVEFPNNETWAKQGREAYSGRDLFLKVQDPAKPEYLFGFEDYFCDSARTRQDAAASIEFLKIELSETTRLGAKQRGIDAIRSMIQTLESLPAEQPPRK